MKDIIIECTGKALCASIAEIGNIKYHLPLINAYVLEVKEEDVALLCNTPGITLVHNTTSVTTQMQHARKVVKADAAHRMGIYGRDITIAVLDTGISPVKDLTATPQRMLAFKDFINSVDNAYDDNGHGTHVAGIAAGSGMCSDGKYAGIAPMANVIGIKVLDEDGNGSSSDVLAGLQWIVDNKCRYNIRIANLSVGTHEIFHNDPLVRGVEAAWDCGIVMTIAAGNNGPTPSSVTSPGISRKVITVGTSDDHAPVEILGRTAQYYSGRGPTNECIIKPDILAPGAAIISCLSQNLPERRSKSLSANIVTPNYLSLSGTSMSTPVVSGAIALLLELHPHLHPDEVKLLLKLSSADLNKPKNHQGWGLLDIERLISLI